MSSKIWFATQDIRFPLWFHAHVHESGTGGVKLLQPHLCSPQPFGPGIEYMGRPVWNADSDKQFIARTDSKAAAHEFVYDWMKPIVAKCPWVTIWTGHNEVDVTTPEACQQFAAYEIWRIHYMRRLLDDLHYPDVKIAASSLGTGNPPHMEYWEWIGRGIAEADYTELHEYGMGRMNIDGFHLGRCERSRDACSSYGHRWPPTIIGETGIDRAGDPLHDGWQAQGISSEEYVQQIMAYDLWCQQRDWIVGVAPFVWLSTGWPSFDFDEYTSSILVAKMREQGLDIEQLIGAAVHQRIMPLNPLAAFEKAGTEKRLLPAMPEDRIDIGGKRYAYQAYRDADDRDWIWIVYTAEGDWDSSHFHWSKVRN